MLLVTLFASNIVLENTKRRESHNSLKWASVQLSPNTYIYHS